MTSMSTKERYSREMGWLNSAMFGARRPIGVLIAPRRNGFAARRPGSRVDRTGSVQDCAQCGKRKPSRASK